MYYLGFFIASVFSCKVSATAQAPPIGRIVADYFNSQSVKSFRSAWEYQKKPIEHAIKTALAETVGLPGMNVYIRKIKEKLAVGYVHDDNHVRLFLKDLNLKTMPRCRLPDLHFSLASNVLKIQSKLSEMIIQANYSIVRNQNNIIYETENQNPFKYSPFLFVQVEDIGQITIRIDDCTLLGFIVATLSGDSVNLGYDYFKLTGCVYTLEIYKENSNSMPVIAKYNLDTEGDDVLSVTDLVLRPLLTEELMPKMQAAVFSIVNASAVFGSKFIEYRDNQEIVFQTTAQYMTELIRNLNRLTVERNGGVIDMEDYVLQLNEENPEETVQLRDMVLFGLNTMYSAHTGGPLKTGTVMIAEEIRFSTLQVRGTLQLNPESDGFLFTTEITDLVVDVHLEEDHWNTGFRTLEVKWLRRMSFAMPSITHAAAENMIGGYLLNAVPKLVHAHLTSIFKEAVHPNKL